MIMVLTFGLKRIKIKHLKLNGYGPLSHVGWVSNQPYRYPQVKADFFMAKAFNWDKLRKPNKSVWIQKCRVCKIPTARGYYCPAHRKKGTMNKWEWYIQYGLDKEMKNFNLDKQTSCSQFGVKAPN